MSYTLELMEFPSPSQASLLEGAPIVIWGTVYPIKHSDLHQKNRFDQHNMVYDGDNKITWCSSVIVVHTIITYYKYITVLCTSTYRYFFPPRVAMIISPTTVKPISTRELWAEELFRKMMGFYWLECHDMWICLKMASTYKYDHWNTEKIYGTLEHTPIGFWGTRLPLLSNKQQYFCFTYMVVDHSYILLGDEHSF